MSDEQADGCLVCAEIDGSIGVPGRLLASDEHVVAFHSPILEPAQDVYEGYLFVVSRRHAAGFADLDETEAAAMGVAIARWSRALEAAGAETVYALRAGNVGDHLHVHLVPRWPGTPSEVSWMRVDEWPGARRIDADAAAELTARLRAT